ncbi:MAG: large subunit ribosomal protein L4 [Polaribacter sp.]|jgi:large subunit ribosomal protein L4
MKLDILNIEGKTTGKSMDLPDDIFSIEPNEHVVYLAVKQYNANQRQGTHSAKERGEVKGSTRKIKKQKGTGTARAGDIKSPIFRGGGRIFGPRPRDYGFKLNKKVSRLARKSALSNKATQGKIVIVEDFTFDTPKTAEFKKVLKNLSLDNSKTVFVTGDHDKVLYSSSRNVKNASVTRAQDLNTYEIMNANTLVLAASAVDKIKQTFGK